MRERRSDPSATRLAVLIDADNASSASLADMLGELSRYGSPSVKRAYGDWTTPNLAGWKGVLHSHAIHPVQQFRYTTGKNATDSALIIDAMDLLHAGHVDGFCLVSSDSDFTRLAGRIREAGLLVIGVGERKTPAPFVSACDRFIFTEILRDVTSPATLVPAGTDTGLERMLRDSILDVAGDDGWAALSAVGGLLVMKHPSFDSRNYDFRKLGELVRQQPYLDVRNVPSGAQPSTRLLWKR